VNTMKAVNAVIGGAGNGGIIVTRPALWPGCVDRYRAFPECAGPIQGWDEILPGKYPDYFISKNKIELRMGIDVPAVAGEDQNEIQEPPPSIPEDGLKIEFDNDWVHLRSSNTEPIIRIYAESSFETTANNIALRAYAVISRSLARLKGSSIP